jgi:outer membrane immunogenic protein
MFIMPRSILLASAAAVMAAGAAIAAEPPPPPPLPVAPIFTWTGLYLGINIGGHWGGSATQFTGTDTDGAGLGSALSAGAIPGTGSTGATGVIGGGTIGYNYQWNSFVLGLEVDVDGASGRKTLQTIRGPEVGFVPVAFNSSQTLDWLGTLRGRVGLALMDRLLIYSTGGFAFGQSVASFSAVAPTADPPLAAFATNRASTGWTAGGGIEYGFPNNWSVKAEYLYYNLGRTTGTIVYLYSPDFSTLTGVTRHSGNIVRAGLNYKFSWEAPAPVVAKY